MKIIIFGATGRTGRILTQRCMEAGFQVTVYVRNPHKITWPGLNMIQGQITDVKGVEAAIAGQDVVISCLSSDDKKGTQALYHMTKIIVDAMVKHDIKRFLGIASAGIHKEFSSPINILVKILYGPTIKDHAMAFDYVQSADLNYTFARPLSLTDGPYTGQYRQTASGVPRGGKEIARADVADFLMKVIADVNYHQTSIGLAY